MTDIDAVSSDNVYAVGRYIAIRWNGKVWQRIPGEETNQNFRGVTAVSADTIYTIGSVSGCGPFAGCSSSQFITRYNGTNWSLVSIADNLQFTNFQGISSSDPANVWIVGSIGQNSLVLRLENGSFRRTATETTPNLGEGYDVLTSVSALNAKEVWTVGGTEIESASQHRSNNLALRGSLTP